MCTYQKIVPLITKKVEGIDFSENVLEFFSGTRDFFHATPTVFFALPSFKHYNFASSSYKKTQPPPKKSPHQDEQNDVLVFFVLFSYAFSVFKRTFLHCFVHVLCESKMCV